MADDNLPPTIVVQLHDGRQFTAMLDPDTDAQRLVLRWERGRMLLVRPVAWSDVFQASIEGKIITGEQFQQIIAHIRQALPKPPAGLTRNRWMARLTPLPPELPDAAEPFAAEPTAPPAAMPEPRMAGGVQTLSIDAELGRWGPSANPDGLVLHVYPLTADGMLVPVDGTLEVDLVGEDVGPVRPNVPFESLAHWAQAVHADDVGPRGAVLRLPFQGVNPEFTTRLGTHGLVYARLSVPGHGTYEAQQVVRVRPYNVIRDRYEQATGQRYSAVLP